MTDPGQVKQIPYGIADYTLIREENYYFIDKSRYIRELEQSGRFLFFIRPRRFGKSFFLSMLDCYYDILAKNRFDELFRDTAIYKKPTPEQGRYLVLHLNFSQINKSAVNLEESFSLNIRLTSQFFIEKYRSLLSGVHNLEHTEKRIMEDQLLTHTDALSILLTLTKIARQPVYVIIDEYDNFANTILTEKGSDAYMALTHGEGWLRSFFNILKAGTTGPDAPVKRLFITGVSPITMDDVTSGFNIGEQISLLPGLNAMLGFTRKDIEDLLDYYEGAGLLKLNRNVLLELMDHWYGNYRFAKQEKSTLYNTDMILYFIKNCLSQGEIPENLVDRNVRIDYGKLRNLIVIDRGASGKPVANGNFSKLKHIIETGEAVSPIVESFPMTQIAEPDYFYSQLFYFGLLTIKGIRDDNPILAIPNETIRRLFYDYIESAYRETGVLAFNMDRYLRKMADMAYRGDWKGLFDYITGQMNASLALRDLIKGEKSIQTFLNVYLGLSDYYIVHAEKEMNRGYVDLFLAPFFIRYPSMRYAYLLEIKYIPAGEKLSKTKLAQRVQEAEEQLKQYSLDAKMQKALGGATLIKLALIFSGSQVVYIGAY